MSDEARLYLQFVETETVLDPTDTLTFGRGGDLVIDDDNPYLHRVLGKLSCQAGEWRLANVGSTTVLVLTDPNGPSQATIGPGVELSIPHSEFLIRFSAGPSHYEIEGSCDLPSTIVTDTGDDDLDHLDATLQWGVVSLNDEQRLLLTALAEQHLREPGTSPTIPPSRQIARRLNWSSSKFNRKLDHLCDKFSRAGVSGLRGDLGEIANERRKRLVTHAISARLIGPDDLDLLESEVRS